MPGFLQINYNDGGKPLEYKGLELSYDKNGEEVKQFFDTGDFVKDWYDYMKTVAHFDESFFNENYTIMYSSSVDHFQSDGGSELYDIKYLKVMDEGEKILFTKRKGSNGIKFYVNKGSDPSWDEMKNKYDDKIIEKTVQG